MKLLFDILFVISSFLIYIMLSGEIIYYSQLDGYVVKSVLTRLYQKVKDNLLNVFMCFVIMLSMYIINFDNITIHNNNNKN